MSNIVLWADNAGSTLASSITTSQTTITLTSGGGTLFPSPATGQFFALSLTQSGTEAPQEIVYCTARSGNTLTVKRAQEGTSGTAFNAGDLAQNLITAGTLGFGDFPTGVASLSANTTITGANAGTFYNVNGSYTITLNASTFTAGQTIGFLAVSACTITASSGTFYGGSLSGSSISMPAGSFVALQWDGANWRQLAGSFASSPSLLAGNGWKKIPDSNSPTGYFIIQWGINVGSIATGVTFPLAFPTAVLSVTISEGAASVGNWGSGIPTIHAVGGSPTTTGFLHYSLAWNSGSWTAVGNTAFWIAVGY